MVTAAALKLTVTTGKFRPKYHGHFPPEQVVTLFIPKSGGQYWRNLHAGTADGNRLRLGNDDGGRN